MQSKALDIYHSPNLQISPKSIAKSLLHSPFVVSQLDPLSHEAEELLEGGRVRLVAEQLLLGGLAGALVDEAELEVVDEHVFVVGHDHFGPTRRHHRLEPLHRQLLLQALREKNGGS